MRVSLLLAFIIFLLPKDIFTQSVFWASDGGVPYVTNLKRPNIDIRKSIYIPRKPPKKNYNKWIAESAKKYKVDEKLLHALISAESGYKPYAISSKGAIGLMQLMPETAKNLKVNPFNPKENIDGGTRYFKLLLNRFNGDVKKAVAAYNAGPKAVEKYGEVPPYRETRRFVRKVFNNFNGQPPKPKEKVYTRLSDRGKLVFTNLPGIH